MNAEVKLPLVIMGVAGAGKTSIGTKLAGKLNATFIDGDDYHPQQSITKMKEGLPLTDEDRLIWLKVLNKLLVEELKKGTKIILACSALKSVHRRILSQHLQLSFVYLKIDRKTAKQRLSERKHHFFTPSLLDNQFHILEEPQGAIIINAADPMRHVLKNILQLVET